MSNPLVSVIIPCYNHGAYLEAAINSIPVVEYPLIEVIVVNDGSKDANTISVLEKVSNSGVKVIHQENSGLANARNTGIRNSLGKYILPLDSDNELLLPYFSVGVAMMEQNENIDVIYGDPIFFGSENGLRKVADFNLQSLITGNFIDACALIRKESLLKVGAYDEKMPFMGIEDWDLWLNLAFNGFKFHHISEPSFKYRVLANSMIKKDTAPNYHKLRKYLQRKYSQYINYDAPIAELVKRFKASPPAFLFKLILISWFPKYYKKLVDGEKIKPF